MTDFTLLKDLDFIGDIHGYGDPLEKLLMNMGYVEVGVNNFVHEKGRKVVFIGDYIDRGPKILRTLRIVRTMQENGNAFAIMGNHEFNFLCYHYKDENGNTFRSLKKKTEEEELTDNALGDELDGYLQWMARLPLFFENDFCRGVHAQWDQKSIDLITAKGIACLDEQGLRTLHKDEALLSAYEIVLKGSETYIPDRYHYQDKNGKLRKEARQKWWLNQPGNTLGTTFATLPDHLLNEPFDVDHDTFVVQYLDEEKPVFFGHYWMPHAEFIILRENICCIDYSIAKKGVLAAYRYDGETPLKQDNLIHHLM
jgi:hypothetical protein